MGEEVSPLSPSPAAACAALPSVEQQVERELQKTQNRFHLSLGAALLFAFLFFFSSLPAASASSVLLLPDGAAGLSGEFCPLNSPLLSLSLRVSTFPFVYGITVC